MIEDYTEFVLGHIFINQVAQNSDVELFYVVGIFDLLDLSELIDAFQMPEMHEQKPRNAKEDFFQRAAVSAINGDKRFVIGNSFPVVINIIEQRTFARPLGAVNMEMFPLSDVRRYHFYLFTMRR